MPTYQELGFASYKDYLKSEHWQSVRQRFRRKECLVCGNPLFQLHHVTYERLGRERDADLRPLCEPHHQAVHQIVQEKLSETDMAIRLLRDRRKVTNRGLTIPPKEQEAKKKRRAEALELRKRRPGYCSSCGNVLNKKGYCRPCTGSESSHRYEIHLESRHCTLVCPQDSRKKWLDFIRATNPKPIHDGASGHHGPPNSSGIEANRL